jgi:hypothetical protein
LFTAWCHFDIAEPPDDEVASSLWSVDDIAQSSAI